MDLKALVRLQESLAKLPSIGKKSAERMAFAMLEMEDEDLNEFADAIKELKTKIHLCPICGNITEDDECYICKDESRDRETILVVSSPKDVIAFENAEGYHGLYHVLGGTISSLIFAPNLWMLLEVRNLNKPKKEVKKELDEMSIKGINS